MKVIRKIICPFQIARRIYIIPLNFDELKLVLRFSVNDDLGHMISTVSTILVKSFGILYTFAEIWSFRPPPFFHPQYNVDVDSF